MYRLVNSIYVLGITSADLDDDTNVYECVGIVNQAVKYVSCFALTISMNSKLV